jgi:hypothetical protein
MNAIVYALIDPNTNIIRYIGKSINGIKRGDRLIAKDINGNEIIGFYAIRKAAELIGGKCSHTGIRNAIKNKSIYYNFY